MIVNEKEVKKALLEDLQHTIEEKISFMKDGKVGKFNNAENGYYFALDYVLLLLSNKIKLL